MSIEKFQEILSLYVDDQEIIEKIIGEILFEQQRDLQKIISITDYPITFS